MKWEDEQQAFWDWITQPQDLRSSTAAIDNMFAPQRELSQTEALGIYNNAFHQRLIQISSELYPIVYHTLGQDVYTRLWLEYLSEHKPRPGSMSLLGEHLHAFASEHPQFGRLPALLDIIKLESLLIELFDRVDEQPYTLTDLQKLPTQSWADTRWQARQDWALLQSGFDLEGYWAQMQQFLDADNSLPGKAEFGVRANPDGNKVWYLIRRVSHRMQFQRINNAMALFLQSIQDGEPFAVICERLADALPEENIPRLSLELLLKSIELELIAAQ
jgi:hypothetical protein